MNHKLSEREKKLMLKIFRALSDYIAEGGTVGVSKLARETLFYIYEGGASGKHDRALKSVKAAATGKAAWHYEHAIPLSCWLYGKTRATQSPIPPLKPEDSLIGRCRNLSDEEILEEIKLHDHVRIITKEESQQLQEFKDSMPAGWHQPRPENCSAEEWNERFIAKRYHQARIKF